MAVSTSPSPWMRICLAACAVLMLSPRYAAANPPPLSAALGDLDDGEVEYHAAAEPMSVERLLRPSVGIRVPIELNSPGTKERLTAWLPTDAADVSEELLQHMKDFLRCRRTGRKHDIDPRLIAMLGKVAERFPGKEIEIVSGYRVGHGVKNSKHFKGRAIDFRVVGVPAATVRDFVWQSFDHVGVGAYRGRPYIHLDIRPDQPKLGWTQRRMGAHYRYNPWWTRKGQRVSGS